MAKKENISNVLVKKAKKHGKAKKHPNKHKSTKPYNSQGR